jgi:hypothetical protein
VQRVREESENCLSQALASIHFLALKIILCRVAEANTSAVGAAPRKKKKLKQRFTRNYGRIFSFFLFLVISCENPLCISFSLSKSEERNRLLAEKKNSRKKKEKPFRNEREK